MEMIKANKDPNVLIKEKAKHCIHVRLTQINVNPNNPQHPSRVDKIAVFTPEEFDKMEKQRYAKHPFVWYRVAGFAEAFVVHDGRLEPAQEEPEAIKEEVIAAEAIQKVVKEAVKKERRKSAVRAALNKKA